MHDEHTDIGAFVQSLEGAAAPLDGRLAPSVTATLASQVERKAAFLTAYVEAARRLPCVDEIYADATAGLRLYTVYHGDARAPIYEAEGAALDAVPAIRARFYLINGLRGDMSLLPASARRIFWRG